MAVVHSPTVLSLTSRLGKDGVAITSSRAGSRKWKLRILREYFT